MPMPSIAAVMNAVGAKSQSAAPRIYEFIQDRLYLTSFANQPPKSDSVHYFSVDQELAYIHFYSDFGPNNLCHVIRFIAIMNSKLQHPQLANKKLVLWSSLANDKRANATYLMCMYMMLVHRQSPEEAFAPVQELVKQLQPYRDAGYGPATFWITVLDCLKGLNRAMKKGLIKLEEFDLQETEYYEAVEHGDMNWVLPGKFLAFATPHDETSPDYGIHRQPYRAPRTRIEDTIEYFKKCGITTVVRLNNKTYDRQKFIRAGINHIDMYFPDGSCPPDEILHEFIAMAERTPGKIAVHCKAGLGRTGTLIAAYIMKHYHFTASEVISWLRVARPGSVVGPQQNYLQSIQSAMWRLNTVRQRSAGELVFALSKSSSSTAIERIEVEPSDVLASIAIVDNVEMAVPIQPRKGEISADGAYIVASVMRENPEQYIPRSEMPVSQIHEITNVKQQRSIAINS